MIDEQLISIDNFVVNYAIIGTVGNINVLLASAGTPDYRDLSRGIYSFYF